MVGHASLRKIVGPDPLGAVAGADLALSRGGAFGLKPGAFGVIQPRAQDLHRLGAVLVLGFLVLLADHDAGRDMGDPHCRVSGVHRLPPGARSTEHIDPKIALLNIDIDILGLWQHRDGGSRCMDAAAGFGFGNTLHAVNAGFEFQPREHIASGDVGSGLLVAADAGLGHFHHLEPPAMLCRKSLIHAEQVGGEQRRLVTTGTGAHLEDRVSRIVPVARQQKKLQAVHLLGKPGLDLLNFGLRHLRHFGVVSGLLGQHHGRVPVTFEPPDKVNLLADRPQFGQLARQAGQLVRRHRSGIGKPRFNLVAARQHLVHALLYAHDAWPSPSMP